MPRFKALILNKTDTISAYMKILHLINLQGFGGAERLFIEYLKNSSFTNEVLCSSNQINENIISELKSYKIIYANCIGNTSVKYPAFLRKHILSRKINRRNPDITLVWDFVPKLNKNLKIVFFCIMTTDVHGAIPRIKKHLPF